MPRPTLTLLVGATLLVSGGLHEAAAGRTRRTSDLLGGSAQRARSGGEALAQSFYERAVNLGKQQQFGQAEALMKNVVRKNPSNEKYRYYYALLLYKIGDFGQSASECRLLERGSLERYRRKGRALMARIDKINTGEIPLVQPLRPAPFHAPGATAMRNLRGLPESAYMNVADMAAMAANGRAPGVVLRTSPVMSRADYRDLRGEAPAPGFGTETLGDQIATVATETVERNSLDNPLNADAGWVDPEDLASDMGGAEVTDSNNPFTGDMGWIDPQDVKPAKVATPKVSSPKPVATAPSNPFEPSDNAFADAAFDEVANDAASQENVWDDEDEPAKPVAKPAPKPAPKPVAKPPPPPPPPPPTQAASSTDAFSDNAFGDDAFGDGGFGDSTEEAPSTPAPPAPPAEESGFGEDDGFDSFEGF